MRHAQHPARDRGGRLARGETLGPTVPIWPLQPELADE